MTSIAHCICASDGPRHVLCPQNLCAHVHRKDCTCATCMADPVPFTRDDVAYVHIDTIMYKDEPVAVCREKAAHEAYCTLVDSSQPVEEDDLPLAILFYIEDDEIGRLVPGALQSEILAIMELDIIRVSNPDGEDETVVVIDEDQDFEGRHLIQVQSLQDRLRIIGAPRTGKTDLHFSTFVLEVQVNEEKPEYALVDHELALRFEQSLEEEKDVEIDVVELEDANGEMEEFGITQEFTFENRSFAIMALLTELRAYFDFEGDEEDAPQPSYMICEIEKEGEDEFFTEVDDAELLGRIAVFLDALADEAEAEEAETEEAKAGSTTRFSIHQPSGLDTEAMLSLREKYPEQKYNKVPPSVGPLLS